MIYENWLHTDLLNTRTNFCPPLMGRISCDVLVIGGGFAGLHAALRLAESGKDVVLLERSICGGSSSGKSGGFLTPSTESDLIQLIGLFGIKEAKLIYEIPVQGINLIVNAIKKNNLKFTNLLFNDNLNNNKIDIKSPPFKCAMPWKSLVIDFNGIRPECICPKGDKISTGSALEEIWNGELMQAYRNNVLMNNKNNLCNNNCWMILFISNLV